jgi:hypothetical protein
MIKLLWITLLFINLANARPQHSSLKKIFILHTKQPQAQRSAKLWKELFLKKSQIPGQFMELVKVESCDRLPQPMKAWDWHLVVCINQKQKVKLIRFRREVFYTTFSPYWN